MGHTTVSVNFPLQFNDSILFPSKLLPTKLLGSNELLCTTYSLFVLCIMNENTNAVTYLTHKSQFNVRTYVSLRSQLVSVFGRLR
jgi:hypothetical protein